MKGCDKYGDYIGIDMKNGIVTREYIEDGIPQPYDAGKLTKESLEMLQERRIAETEKNKKSEKEVNKEGAKISIKEKLENYKEEIAKKNTEITKQKNYNNELQFDCFFASRSRICL